MRSMKLGGGGLRIGLEDIPGHLVPSVAHFDDTAGGSDKSGGLAVIAASGDGFLEYLDRIFRHLYLHVVSGEPRFSPQRA